jgi:heme exporter protein A
MTLFEGRDLTCHRGLRQVFTGLDFALPAGGVLLLTGANGSGKSTLLRIMAGLLRPVAGELVWDGVRVADDPEAHNGRVHYLGHQDAVKPILSAAENLAFWAGLRGRPNADVEQALEHFGLAHLAGVAGRMLSAGQKRRLALARLLVSPAELWLLDEPSVGLDDASLDSLGAAITRHRSDGGRVAAATHVRLPVEGAEELTLDDFCGGPQVELAW